jgi:hypothetical protein
MINRGFEAFRVASWITFLTLTGVGPSGAGPTLDRLPVEELRVEPPGGAKPITLTFHESAQDRKHGVAHQCTCRAVLFRALQIVAEGRPGGVLKIADLKQVRSGWASEANRAMLCDTLGLAKARFKHSSEMPPCRETVVSVAWWQFTFLDGKSVTVWARPKALPDDFRTLHAEHKRGDNSEAMRAVLDGMKEQLALTLTQTPLDQLFVVVAD